MARAELPLRRRSSVLGDLRIILLGTWAFLLQVYRSWRLTPKLLDRNDEHEP
jgi:hypothetical protein